MKLAVIPIVQNKKTMFMGIIRIGDLFDHFELKVDTQSSKKNKKGYQRKSTKRRAMAFLRYIEKTKDATSPNTILLNYRENLKIEETPGAPIYLDFPEKATLWVVDGQHRLRGLEEGLKNDEIRKFEIPFVIMNETEKYLEALQFFIINRTQKGVKSDLAQIFLQEVEKREPDFLKSNLPTQIIRNLDWNPGAVRIMEKLIERVDSPWFNKIQLANEPKLKTIIPQTSFIDSLEPILKDDNFMISIDHKDDILTELLIRYWQAIKELCLKAFEDPKNYVIQKTVGLFTLHKLFVKIFSLSKDENNKITTSSIKRVLSQIPEVFNSEYWRSNVGEAGKIGSNKKSFSFLAKKINNELSSKISVKVKPFEL
jgi:DGQHR domain-containing protein